MTLVLTEEEIRVLKRIEATVTAYGVDPWDDHDDEDLLIQALGKVLDFLGYIALPDPCPECEGTGVVDVGIPGYNNTCEKCPRCTAEGVTL